MSNHRFVCLVITILALSLTLLFTSCGSTSADAETKTEIADDDVWDYTHSEHLPINPLYCEGQKRVGCIGCPNAGRGGRQREFMRWPAYEKMYISAFERMLDVRKAKGLPCDWQTGMDVFRWWMEDDNISGQLSMDDLMEDNNV